MVNVPCIDKTCPYSKNIIKGHCVINTIVFVEAEQIHVEIPCNDRAEATKKINCLNRYVYENTGVECINCEVTEEE
jgi:hypothetical protein